MALTHQPEKKIKPYAQSPQQGADYIGCSRQHIYQLMSDGRLPSYKIGRSRRIKTADLEALLNERAKV